ncbi:flagellar basal-body MS-ring/collar protein FliF [Nocardioides panacisoli]|uniref:Flagellar M-ring protein n=1 Tax=Nocardioides panacisoli TaxID=627624 RepID=A0ABP7HUC2_9ACTN
MRDRMMGALGRARETFSDFTVGQKAVAVIGTAALLIGAVMVFRWVSTPSYAPLYSDLSGSDASAVVDELDAEGVSYKLTNGGSTIMVPKSDVYSTRIALNGKGLPSSDAGGYSLLDNQSLSTSDFQEQTDFKRAMEGELDKTIEAMDGIDTAVVHLALPEKQVFAEQQDPATASVLVATTPGVTLSSEQVQAIVHLVASSIDGLDPNQVTVTDSAGNVLAMPGQDDVAGGGLTGNRYDQVEQFENDMQGEVQQMMDTVFGPGNSKVTATADLDFDHATIESRTYTVPKDLTALSESKSSETYTGPGAGGTAGGGVVGPDGQMDPSAVPSGSDSAYENKSSTRDNAVDQTVEHRETAPGSVKSLHIGVVVDTAAAAGHDMDEVSDLIRDSIGIDRKRGDTIEATQMAFDHSAAEEAQAELEAAQKAKADAAKKTMYRNIAIGGGIALLVLLAWAQARRRAKAREQATSYVVEQLRADAAARAPIEPPAPAVAALEAVEETEEDRVRDELIALVERQPEDVAALLRGWLVEPR